MSLDDRYRQILIEDYDECKCWEDIQAELNHLHQTGKWVFRGQANALWGLQTSMERFVQQVCAHQALEVIPDPKRIEEMVYDDFTTRFPQYVNKRIKQPANTMEYLGVMQHYGAPTRLLDWSLSPSVAAFFAYDDIERDSAGSELPPAIWALDTSALFDFSTAFAREHGVLLTTLPDCSHSFVTTSIASDIIKQGLHAVLPIQLPKLDQRMERQQAAFTVFCGPYFMAKTLDPTVAPYIKESDGHNRKNPRLFTSLMELLLHLYIKTGQKCLRRFVLPVAEHRSVALELLDTREEINREYLVPGIDGLAQAVRKRTLRRCDYGHVCNMVSRGSWQISLDGEDASK